MRLVDINCSKCNGQMKVNPDLKKCICIYCGNEMYIDDEIVHHRIENGFSFGYEQEMGRLKAQEDYRLQKEKERQDELAKKRIIWEESSKSDEDVEKRGKEIRAMFERELARREGRSKEEHIYLSK